jgi:chorismate-pyruvate lyase
LTPLQRILLITDGTVTEILGAYRGEPIRIVKLHQGIEPAPTDWPALEIAAGEPLLRRRILLVGQETGEVLIAADSRCVLARLPEGIRVALLTTTRPIGQLLLEARLETFREVLRCGLCPWPEAAAAFDLAAVQPLVVRVYRVLAGGQPLMEITEGFPPAP